MKWMVSHYTMIENESFDLIGDYLLGEVETDPSQSNVGEIRLSRVLAHSMIGQEISLIQRDFFDDLSRKCLLDKSNTAMGNDVQE